MTQVQIQALLSQLTEARGLLRSELQSGKEACKRAETAERELEEVKRKLEEITLKQTEDEKNNQIQVFFKIVSCFLNFYILVSTLVWFCKYI